MWLFGEIVSPERLVNELIEPVWEELGRPRQVDYFHAACKGPRTIPNLQAAATSAGIPMRILYTGDEAQETRPLATMSVDNTALYEVSPPETVYYPQFDRDVLAFMRSVLHVGRGKAMRLVAARMTELLAYDHACLLADLDAQLKDSQDKRPLVVSEEQLRADLGAVITANVAYATGAVDAPIGDLLGAAPAADSPAGLQLAAIADRQAVEGLGNIRDPRVYWSRHQGQSVTDVAVFEGEEDAAKEQFDVYENEIIMRQVVNQFEVDISKVYVEGRQHLQEEVAGVEASFAAAQEVFVGEWKYNEWLTTVLIGVIRKFGAQDDGVTVAAALRAAKVR
jgi:hypothetical protein